MGVLAFKRGYAQWSDAEGEAAEGLASHVLAALHELRTAATSLG
jgi:hypothetical protein